MGFDVFLMSLITVGESESIQDRLKNTVILFVICTIVNIYCAMKSNSNLTYEEPDFTRLSETYLGK